MKKEFDLGAIIAIRFGGDSAYSSEKEVSELYEYLVGGKYKEMNKIRVHRKCFAHLKREINFFKELGRHMSKFRNSNKSNSFFGTKAKKTFVNEMKAKYNLKYMIKPISNPLITKCLIKGSTCIISF
jgi:hypothetical protein